MPYLDTVGPFVGKFDQSPGGGPWGANYGGAIADSLDIARRRPKGTAWSTGFGRGDILNTRKFQPDMLNRTYFALNERPDPVAPAARSTTYAVGDYVTATVGGKPQVYKATTASGSTLSTAPAWPTSGTVNDGGVTWTWLRAGSTYTASETWARAAVPGLSQLEASGNLVVSAFIEPITGYPSAPVAKLAKLSIQREMSSSGNELPILNDVDAANAVTFYRRMVPQWRATLAAAGCKLVIHWNNAGGSGSNYNNVLLAYPGDDIVDEMAGDTYDSDDTGLYPYSFAPLWRRCTLSTATAAGVTSIVRDSFQVGPQAGDLVEIGTGTGNVEQVSVSSVSGATITFSTALTKSHGNGDFLTKVYSKGAKVTNYAMQFISLVGNNAAAPSPEPWTDTAAWAAYPFDRIDGVTPQPGVNCMTPAEQAIAVDAQHKAFAYKFFGQKADGSTTRYHVQFWYDFARTGIVPAGHSVDPRIPTPAGGKPYVIREIGMFGVPSTNYKGTTGGGDDHIWAGDFLAWCAAMAAAHPEVPPPSWIWWNHNNGTAGAYTQVFGTLPPWGTVPQTDGVIRPAYFPRTARVLLEGQKPAAQLYVPELPGASRPFTSVPAVVATDGGGGTAYVPSLVEAGA